MKRVYIASAIMFIFGAGLLCCLCSIFPAIRVFFDTKE